MINIQYRLYQKTGYLNKYIDIKDIASKLSERYKRCATQQVVGQLQLWLSIGASIRKPDSAVFIKDTLNSSTLNFCSQKLTGKWLEVISDNYPR